MLTKRGDIVHSTSTWNLSTYLLQSVTPQMLIILMVIMIISCCGISLPSVYRSLPTSGNVCLFFLRYRNLVFLISSVLTSSLILQIFRCQLGEFSVFWYLSSSASIFISSTHSRSLMMYFKREVFNIFSLKKVWTNSKRGVITFISTESY